MSQQILIATTNPRKIRELALPFEALGCEIFTLKDFEKIDEAPEDNAALSVNALGKARYYSEAFEITAVADDSGIFVRGLGERPGVLSARYSGDTNPAFRDYSNRAKLLKELAGCSEADRAARICVSVAIAGSVTGVCIRELRGMIGHHETGHLGWGYESIFKVPFRGTDGLQTWETCSYAQLSTAEQLTISPRYAAARKIASLVESRIDW